MKTILIIFALLICNQVNAEPGEKSKRQLRQERKTARKFDKRLHPWDERSAPQKRRDKVALIFLGGVSYLIVTAISKD